MAMTVAQFAADPWIRREIVTDEMTWLGDELCRRTRRPRSAAGTKGDRFHPRGAHRSQEFIERSPLCTSRTYTRQAGLTALQKQQIAGFDFTPGSVAAMVAQCRRIYAAMRAGLLAEVLEFYGNVDGDQVVDGWDNLHHRAATSDSSHLWHWHLTIDRRHCANRELMARIIAIALGDTPPRPAPTTRPAHEGLPTPYRHLGGPSMLVGFVMFKDSTNKPLDSEGVYAVFDNGLVRAALPVEFCELRQPGCLYNAVPIRREPISEKARYQSYDNALRDPDLDADD